jgi:serine/threonine protein kinase
LYYIILISLTGKPKEWFNALAIERMDQSLGDWMRNPLRVGRENRTPLVLHILAQMVKIVQVLHDIKLIHRDIKPDNFLIRGEGLKMNLFLSDFGLSKRYVKNNQHIEHECPKEVILGTSKYQSKNVLNSNTPSRRDDLLSVIYIALELAMGKLPWTDFKKKHEGQSGLDKKVKKFQINLENDDLFHQIPEDLKFIRAIFEEAEKLHFDERPEYEKIITFIKHQKGYGIQE